MAKTLTFNPLSGNFDFIDVLGIGDEITGLTQGAILFGGASGVLAQDATNFFWDDTNDRLGLLTNTPNAKIEIDSDENVSILLGEGHSTQTAAYINLKQSDGTSNVFNVTETDATFGDGGDGDSGYQADRNTTAVLTLAHDFSENTQGLYAGTITAGNLVLEVTSTEMTAHQHFDKETSAGITAGTTQTQAGGTALTADVNEVSTVANAGDTVVLPSATAGRRITVINNGANAMKIFPASGDNLGAGVDTAMTTNLATTDMITFTAYDATNWRGVRGTYVT